MKAIRFRPIILAGGSGKRLWPLSINEKHRVQNFGNEVVEIIEVQSGSYFGEDDIIRFEDIYGRKDFH